MHRIRRCFHHAAWVALVAMLGLALAPTLSHALAASAPATPWTEVCSVEGGKAAGATLAHCPLCAPAGQVAVPPVPAATCRCVAPGPDPLPLARNATPAATTTAWAAPPSRAPPLAARL
ncbi:DUF2946 family protein [uncultured Piscinibacter sp.]|uniref:DUF2946 family protein n=1 Tax=uncultured Piscinibacter sp. TaxID=1131835 RepID=UPI00261EC71D|nr:DUF2946 family protein [uncultured Piscinibacter sp.]